MGVPCGEGFRNAFTEPVSPERSKATVRPEIYDTSRFVPARHNKRADRTRATPHQWLDLPVPAVAPFGSRNGMRGGALLDRILLVLAPALCGPSLLLFWFGALGLVDLHLRNGPALAWDAALSLAFFLQHSVMVRRPVQARLARHVPVHDVRAIYAVVSGAALIAVVLGHQTDAVGRGTLTRCGACCRPVSRPPSSTGRALHL